MARTYKRDGNGRFTGGGGGSSGGGSKRPAAKTVSRGVNRLTRDNAGKITSVGGSGATARGGRLKTASGNQRATQTAKVSGGKAKGTISKKRQVAAAPKPTATAKNRASQMRERAGQLDQRGNALMGGGRRDTAAVNLSLNNRARRNETNAGFKGLEMTRNAERLRSKADGIEYRSNESRAKKLRSVHETPIAKAFAKKAGKSVTEVRAAIRSMTPEKQIKMFKQHVKETRSAATAKSRAAKPAAAAARTAAPKPAAAPKSTARPLSNKPATAANSIKPIARSKPAASKIVPITRKKKPTIKEKAKEVKGLIRKMGRSQTREALSGSNLDREIARQSGATKVARTTVQRRQQRAFNVQNGRNPRIGSKALYVYQSQLRELGSTSNKRVPFRRKPMTEAQAKKAASARNAADQKRLLKAINADTESRMTRAPKPKRKRKP